MTKVRSRLLAVALLIAFTLAIGPMLVHAQSGRITAKIPFGFHVGDQEFPPGEYTVDRPVQNTLLIRLSDGAGHTLMTVAIPETRPPEHLAKLIFNKYFDEYFLCEIRWRESSTALQFLPSPRERELAKKTVPQQILTTDKRS